MEWVAEGFSLSSRSARSLLREVLGWGGRKTRVEPRPSEKLLGGLETDRCLAFWALP